MLPAENGEAGRYVRLTKREQTLAAAPSHRLRQSQSRDSQVLKLKQTRVQLKV